MWLWCKVKVIVIMIRGDTGSHTAVTVTGHSYSLG